MRRIIGMRPATDASELLVDDPAVDFHGVMGSSASEDERAWHTLGAGLDTVGAAIGSDLCDESITNAVNLEGRLKIDGQISGAKYKLAQRADEQARLFPEL